MKRLFPLLACFLCLFAAGCQSPPPGYAAIIIATNTGTLTFSDSQGNVQPTVNWTGPPISIALNPLLTVAVTADKTSALPLDTITYTAVCANVGRDTAKGLRLLLAIPAQLQLVTGSVTVDGVAALPAANVVPLPDLAVGAKSVVVFRAQAR